MASAAHLLSEENALRPYDGIQTNTFFSLIISSYLVISILRKLGKNGETWKEKLQSLTINVP